MSTWCDNYAYDRIKYGQEWKGTKISKMVGTPYMNGPKKEECGMEGERVRKRESYGFPFPSIPKRKCLSRIPYPACSWHGTCTWSAPTRKYATAASKFVTVIQKVHCVSCNKIYCLHITFSFDWPSDRWRSLKMKEQYKRTKCRSEQVNMWKSTWRIWIKFIHSTSS